ncbi:autotransporter outer membrane beta-barrel domain-containing protein [Pseudomonas typographi]|uniref:autotransporter outer membrane beta-barrel domain-containing protein n=1 Tax=Pseudomonas typographi TaxID=2715964 RepID=UPI001684A1A2|nr:autotransporter outer membrane beta-barrel domain-containing protein [Pseudomonas typographi]MBD1551273.1 autotransporter domain-containing protein [Pseudomonas typographi]
MGRLNLKGQGRRGASCESLQRCAVPTALALAVALAAAAPVARAACEASGNATLRTPITGPCNLVAPGTLSITQAGAVSSHGAPGVAVSGINGAVSILNAGTLSGAPGVAISDSQLRGGVVNYSAGVITGNAPSGSGVTVVDSRLAEGLVNNGSIQSGTSSGRGVSIESSIVGPLRNRGEIKAADYGLLVLESTVNGNVVNTDSIQATNGLAVTATKVEGDVASAGRLRGTARGLAVTSSTVAGTISTSGTVHGGTAAVRVAYSNVGGSLATHGTITSGYLGVELTNSTVAGGVSNSASITAPVGMLVNGRVAGDVANAGRISASSSGLGTYYATVRGALVNTGIISLQGGVVQTVGGQAALGVHDGSSVAGLFNSGTLLSEGRAAIQVNAATITRRGVRNLGGTVNGHVGIDVATATVAGGIINTGAIDALDNSEDSVGIRLASSQVAGGLANTGSVGGDYAALSLTDSTLSGDLRNSGTLTGLGAGIALQGTSVLAGNLLNSGSIHADGSGIRAIGATISGNLNNSGEVYGSDVGIDLNQTTLGGALLNSGTISSHTQALRVQGSALSGGINNTGSLDAPGGVMVGGSTLSTFYNGGRIQGGSDGVASFIDTQVTGNVINAGTLQGDSDTPSALLLQGSQVDGKVLNSGSVHGVNGISVIGSTLAGGLDISGAVLGDVAGGYAVYVDDTSEVPVLRLLGQDSALIQGSVRAPATDVEVPQGNTFTLQDGNRFEVASFSNQGTLAVAAQSADTETPHDAVATVQGDYTQGAAATLSTRVVDGQHYGRLVVTGTATLPSNAHLDVDVRNAGQLFNVSQLSDVISAGTLVSDGTYNVTSNSQLFTFSGIKDGNTVDLALAAKAADGVSAAVAGNASAQGAARVLDAQLASGQQSALAPYFASATSNAEVANAVQQSLPLTSTLPASQFLQAQLTDSLRDHLQAVGYTAAGAFTPAANGLWLTPFGAQLAPSQRSATPANVAGTLLGADALLSPGTRVGVAFAYGTGGAGARLGGGGQQAQMELYQFTVYASHRLDATTEFSAHAGMGRDANEGRRTLNVGGALGEAQSRFSSQVLNTGVALSQHFSVGDSTRVVPSLTGDYLRIHEPGYHEGGPAALNPLLLQVQARNNDQLLLGFDTRLNHDLAPATQIKARLGVAYDVLHQPNEVTASYAAAPSQRFTTPGDELGAWVLSAGLEFTTRRRGGTALSVSWNAQTRGGYDQQVALLQLSRPF